MNLIYKAGIISLCLVLITVIGSCERKLKKQPDLQSDRLFVTCFIGPQDTILRVNVFNTLAANTEYTSQYYDYNDMTTWSDPNKVNSQATVVLSDGLISVALTYDAYDQAYLANASMLPVVAGKTYFLEVSAPGKRSINAKCTIPKGVDILSVELDSITEYSYTQYYLTGTFVDNPEEGNAYRADATYYYLYKTFGNPPLDSSNYQYGSYTNIGMMTDENGNGNTFKLKSDYIQGLQNDMSYSLFYNVYSIDQNYYKYYRWLKQAEYLSPFAQPTLIYTNINNGLGVFAGYNKSTVLVKRVPPQ